ncbi:hypothetical protein [Kitasatospora sp. GP82]|uniref:hypothetical protein n=1 Tax=Kitasatospora sp. GP82 TaxID=3035089 RepID=UPI0024760D39|nr:hypothetical protein [Kitasatospora sp. GP82]MDH6125389.1 hypothetical protein [Kitasatospora sp. GP82]
MTKSKYGKNPLLSAKAVKGSLVGAAHGSMVAELRDAETNMGIGGELITFSVASSGEDFGQATTNRMGEARLDSGSNILDVQLMAEAASSGYMVNYAGNEKYNPASAKGTFVVSLG